MNRWILMSLKQRQAIKKIKNGWMIQNLLMYGNTLIPNKLIRINGLKEVLGNLQIMLRKFNVYSKIQILKFNNNGDIDYIAELIE